MVNFFMLGVFLVVKQWCEVFVLLLFAHLHVRVFNQEVREHVLNVVILSLRVQEELRQLNIFQVIVFCTILLNSFVVWIKEELGHLDIV